MPVAAEFLNCFTLDQCYGSALRIRILLVTLMRIRILPFTLNAVPDPDPSSQIKIQKTLKKCSSRLIFHTFWLFICKLMRMRIRIQLITLMRNRIRLLFSNSMRIRICNTALDTVEWNLHNHSIPGCRVAGDQVGKMMMHSQSRGRQVICHTQQQVLGKERRVR